MSDWITYLQGAGIIGLIALILIVIVFIILCPLLVAIFLTNVLAIFLIKYGISVSGLLWWALVIVLWLIIAGIISKLREN